MKTQNFAFSFTGLGSLIFLLHMGLGPVTNTEPTTEEVNCTMELAQFGCDIYTNTQPTEAGTFETFEIDASLCNYNCNWTTDNGNFFQSGSGDEILIQPSHTGTMTLTVRNASGTLIDQCTFPVY